VRYPASGPLGGEPVARVSCLDVNDRLRRVRARGCRRRHVPRAGTATEDAPVALHLLPSAAALESFFGVDPAPLARVRALHRRTRERVLYRGAIAAGENDLRIRGLDFLRHDSAEPSSAPAGAETDRRSLHPRLQRGGLGPLGDQLCFPKSTVLMKLFCIGISHHTANVETRERYAGGCSEDAFRTAARCSEALILATCNRGEGYAAAGHSVGSVAVELAGKIFGDLRERSVLLLGAGETSERTARALSSRGVSDIRVSNRSFERAENLAALVRGRAVMFDQWAAQCREVDIL